MCCKWKKRALPQVSTTSLFQESRGRERKKSRTLVTHLVEINLPEHVQVVKVIVGLRKLCTQLCTVFNSEKKQGSHSYAER